MKQQYDYCERSSLSVKMRLREFLIPPVNDGLVIGANAPIGGEAMLRALKLLHVAQFDTIKVNDDIIDQILVKKSLLRKINEDSLLSLVMARVKPFMSSDEVILLDIEVELFIENRV